MKYFNFKRYKFSTVLKNLERLKDYFLTIFKFMNFVKLKTPSSNLTSDLLRLFVTVENLYLLILKYFIYFNLSC